MKRMLRTYHAIVTMVVSHPGHWRLTPTVTGIPIPHISAAGPLIATYHADGGLSWGFAVMQPNVQRFPNDKQAHWLQGAGGLLLPV